MSTNADINIRLTADTAQPIEGLRRTNNELRRTTQSAAEFRRQFGNNRTVVGASAASLEGLSATERQNELFRRQFESQGLTNPIQGFRLKQPEPSSTEKITAMGKAIGLAAGGYLASATVNVLATAIGSQEGGSRTANRISSIGGGAISGAASGAMIGSVVPGLGTAAGAFIGGAVGAVGGAVSSAFSEAKDIREARWGLNHSLELQARDTEVWKQDTSFQRLLGTKGLDEQKLMINNRLWDLQYGRGEDSIDNLRMAQNRLIRNNKTDTFEYRENSERLATQLQRKSVLERQLAELEVAPRAQLLEGSAVSDSLAKMGGQVGPQVDISSVNERQLEMLQKIYEYFTRDGSKDVSQRVDTTFG